MCWAQAPDTIPPFKKLRRYDSDLKFNRDSLHAEHKQVFVLFDAGCGPCQEFAGEFGKVVNQLDSTIDYYFISMQEKPLVDGFINMFAPTLKNNPRVKFLYDPEAEFYVLFNPTKFPSAYIYDRKTFKLLLHSEEQDKLQKMIPYLKKRI